MKNTWFISLLTCLILLLAMLSSAAAGEVLQPSGAGKTVLSGYWSNYLSGPDYSVPDNAFNLPDPSTWEKFYGSYQDAESDSLGALLPFNEEETGPINASFSSSDLPPAHLYPRIIAPIPISPFAPVTPLIQIPEVPLLPLVDILPSQFNGQAAGTPIIPAQPAQIIFPTADLPPLEDTWTGSGDSSGDTGPASWSAIFISDLNVLDEYVKITNNGITPVSMTGWTVRSGSTGRSITFIDWPETPGPAFTFILYPLTTVTIHYGKSGTVTATDLYWPSAQNYWNDAGDDALLYDPDGNLVSTFTR